MRNFVVHQHATEALAHELWEKLPHTGAFWGDYDGTSREDFVRLLAQSVLLIELPFGLLRVDSYTPGGDAHIHGVFWSKEVLRGRALFDEVSSWLRLYLNVSRETIVVPQRSRSLQRLAEYLGFSHLGALPGYYRTVRGCFDGVFYARLS